MHPCKCKGAFNLHLILIIWQNTANLWVWDLSLQFWSTHRKTWYDLNTKFCVNNYSTCPHSTQSTKSLDEFNVAKSRSWTFPAFPSPADSVAPESSAGCQLSLLAAVYRASLGTAGGEAASLREEDSCTEGEGGAPGEEVGVAVLEVQNSVLKVQYSER